MFVGSNWNFVPGYIKNVDTHHQTFSLKKQLSGMHINKNANIRNANNQNMHGSGMQMTKDAIIRNAYNQNMQISEMQITNICIDQGCK